MQAKNSEHPRPNQLRLCGPCAGCDATTPVRGVMAFCTPEMPPGHAAWLCLECSTTVELPWNAALRKRIDTALPSCMVSPSKFTVTVNPKPLDLRLPKMLEDVVLRGMGVRGA